MRRLSPHFMIVGFAGLVIIGISVFIQISSMDLKRYSFEDYVARDGASLGWWQLVVFPLLLGVTYVVLGVAGAWFRLGAKATAGTLLASFVLALALCFGNFGIGLFAVICIAIAAFTYAIRRRRNEASAT